METSALIDNDTSIFGDFQATLDETPEGHIPIIPNNLPFIQNGAPHLAKLVYSNNIVYDT